MAIFLVRHGQDDERVRGGWCLHGLIKEGVAQSRQLGKGLAKESFDLIYMSDLPRTRETVDIIYSYLTNPPEMIWTPELREHDNGDLAGMDNQLVKEKYPGLYY